MDVLQVVLVIMVLIVCIFLIIFGIMLFFILKEMKKALDKLNNVLQTGEDMAEEFSRPVAAAASLVSAIGVGSKAADFAVKTLIGLIKKKSKTPPHIKVKK